MSVFRELFKKKVSIIHETVNNNNQAISEIFCEWLISLCIIRTILPVKLSSQISHEYNLTPSEIKVIKQPWNQ